MRVVTVENFGKSTRDQGGFIYEGKGALFRFTIVSEGHFFKDQLPNLVRLFNIDIRQIMSLALYGGPGGGLFDVRLFISFEKLPKKGQVSRLTLPVQESPIEDHSGGVLENLFVEFVKKSAKREKRSIATELLRNDFVARKQSKPNPGGGDVHHYIHLTGTGMWVGNLVRLHWQDELSPSFADWCNVNFYLAEALRDLYHPRRLVRLEFRAVPDTEHLYDIEVDALAQGSVKVHPIRTKYKGRRMAETTESGGPSRGTVVVQFEVEPPPLEGLADEDRKMIAMFAHLPLEKRISFWQNQLSRFFR